MPQSKLAEEHLQSGTIEEVEYKANDVGWIGRNSNNTGEKKFVWNQDTLIQDTDTFNLVEPGPSMSEGLLELIKAKGVNVIYHRQTDTQVTLDEFERRSVPAESFLFKDAGTYTPDAPSEKQFILQ